MARKRDASPPAEPLHDIVKKKVKREGDEWKPFETSYELMAALNDANREVVHAGML